MAVSQKNKNTKVKKEPERADVQLFWSFFWSSSIEREGLTLQLVVPRPFPRNFAEDDS